MRTIPVLSSIGRGVTAAEEPPNGVISNSLRTFEKTSDVEGRRNLESGRRERHFKVRLSGRQLSKGPSQSELGEAVVKLFDNKFKRNMQSTSEAQEPGWQEKHRHSENGSGRHPQARSSIAEQMSPVIYVGSDRWPPPDPASGTRF